MNHSFVCQATTSKRWQPNPPAFWDRTSVFIGLLGHPTMNTAYYGYRFECGWAYKKFTFTASTS